MPQRQSTAFRRWSRAAGAAICLLPGGAAAVEPSPLAAAIDARAVAIAPRVVEWRRHLHRHPELSNREIETARFVAERLREMGLAPRTGVARTGVVAVLEGGRPGPVVALRADMDALPVREELDLPFASRATGTHEGNTVPVMHACGHDAHVAMLLGAASLLAELRRDLPGKVVLIFQPAEEGAPAGESPAGAEAMIGEGVLEDPPVTAIFGLHVVARWPVGSLVTRPGPVLAAGDRFEIEVTGRQTHGAKPWDGIDPIVVASEIVGALQTLVSRQVDITREPAVVSVGQFTAGVRSNIIPDRAQLAGTIRTFDEGMRADLHTRLRRLAEQIAEAHGASARVTIEPGYPVTVNDPGLTERMLPTLARVADGGLRELPKSTWSEDFSFYARRVPALFVDLGVTPDAEIATAAVNHSPRFFVDERALATGTRALAHLAADYLAATR